MNIKSNTWSLQTLTSTFAGDSFSLAVFEAGGTLKLVAFLVKILLNIL